MRLIAMYAKTLIIVSRKIISTAAITLVCGATSVIISAIENFFYFVGVDYVLNEC